jgi:hypothetical protein
VRLGKIDSVIEHRPDRQLAGFAPSKVNHLT